MDARCGYGEGGRRGPQYFPSCKIGESKEIVDIWTREQNLKAVQGDRQCAPAVCASLQSTHSCRELGW